MSDAALEWRRVPAFADYEVSPCGQVRRATPGRGTYVGRVLRTPLDSEGYPTVNIAKVPRRVHVLVASAFLGPIPVGAEVHHRDENRAHPDVSNLEVVPSRRQHRERHRNAMSRLRPSDEPNQIIECGCGCGARFDKYDALGRPRRYLPGHNTRGRQGHYVREAAA